MIPPIDNSKADCQKHPLLIVLKRQTQKVYDRLVPTISKYSFDENYRAERVKGTCQWILKSYDFGSWRKCTLHMLGSDEFNRDSQMAHTNVFETQIRHTYSTYFLGKSIFKTIASFGMCEAGYQIG